MEPLAQASADARCRMGSQLPHRLIPLAPHIRPAEHKAQFLGTRDLGWTDLAL